MKHIIKIFIAAVILLACVGSANAAAVDSQIQFEILTDDQFPEQLRAAPVYGTVSQGETKRHAYTPGNEQTLEISLQWDRSSGNDLDLYIKPPNNPPTRMQDGVDGRLDGKISLKTSLTSETINRPWTFEVTGAQVSGTQSYTLIINSY